MTPGIRTELVWQPDGTFIINRAQDVESILEHNKALQTMNDGYSPSRELRRVASIPMVIAEKWWNEEGINVFDKDHQPAIIRKLRSSEYAFLRTSPGRV